nr:MAG TPA: hypothetical protein [Caudoviricetes sp.]
MRITKVKQPKTRELYRDEYGNIFEVGFDTCAENPVEVWDNAELCVLAAPHGSQLNDPTDSDCDAMRKLDGFHAENKRLPSTQEWARLCPDYPIDLTECLVEDFSRWADGNAYFVRPVEDPAECTIAPVFADSAEDALLECIENGYFC